MITKKIMKLEDCEIIAEANDKGGRSVSYQDEINTRLLQVQAEKDELIRGAKARGIEVIDPAEDDTIGEDERPQVVIAMLEAATADEVIKHLGNLGWSTPWTPKRIREAVKIYCRGGMLVEAIAAEDPDRKGCLAIRPLPASILRERISQACKPMRLAIQNDMEVLIPTRPPKWLVDSIYSRGWYSGKIRPLAGIVQSPTLRSDGSVLQAPGYDEASGLLYRPLCDFPWVPLEPTREDAQAAAREILEAVGDFPFHDPADRSAWLAMVLTLIARPAIRGCTPMFVVTKNCRGAGGSLLVDCASLIAYGRPAARKVFTRDDDELRKMLTAVAIESLPSVLFDNLDQQLGGAALDAKITSETVSDRILGTSRTTGEIPWRTVLIATGNHVAFGSDVGRRVLPIRLTTPLESPEDRTGFRHPDLLGWIRENRPRLAVAALKIVRAYFSAGLPSQEGGVSGSFENWSAIIRGAIVWAGLPDPLPTRAEAEKSDDSKSLLAMLVAGLEEADPDRTGITVKEIERLTTHKPDSIPTCPTLVAAVAEVCGDRFNAKRFGRRLRSFMGRTWEGRRIVCKDGHGGVKRWTVRPVGVEDGGLVGLVGFANPMLGFHEGSSLDIHGGDTPECKVEPGGNKPTKPTNPPEATTPLGPVVPCPRCGARMVRLATTPIINGFVNYDCPTRGCGHVKAVRVEAVIVKEG